VSKLTAGFQSYGEDLVTVTTSASVAIKALDLDGTDDFVLVGDHATLDITSNLSISAWVNCDSQTGNAAIVTKYNSSVGQRSFFLATNTLLPRKLRFAISDDGTSAAGHLLDWRTNNDVLPASGWAHVAFTFASGTPKLYVDAVEITSFNKVADPGITSIYSSSADVIIGSLNAGSAYFWTGEVCNVSIWDTGVLTQADVTALYNSGNNLDPADLTPSGTASLVSSWLWNSSLPLVPGANDVPDNTGSNDGTTQGTMTGGDVVDSGFTDTTIVTASFGIASGFYKDDDAMATALEAAIQVTFPTIDIFKPGVNEHRWLIEDSGAAVFSLAWDSDNARTYMGYLGDLSAASAYYSSSAVGSTWYPLSGCMDPVFGRLASRRTGVDHTGWSRSAVVGRSDDIKVTAWIEQDEASTAFSVLQRFMRGARGTFRLDASNGTTWAWSAAGWDGEMIVALADPSRRLGFSNYISGDWTGVKQIRLHFVRWV
jgi:hypothetical protein